MLEFYYGMIVLQGVQWFMLLQWIEWYICKKVHGLIPDFVLDVSADHMILLTYVQYVRS